MQLFLDKTIREHDTDCLIWQAATDKDGYGQFRDGKRVRQAHVWAYEQQHGPITDRDDDGRLLELDHKCRRRTCVNVEHLEKVTHAVNMERQRAAQEALDRKTGGSKSERAEQRHRQQARSKVSAAVARALEPLEAALWMADLGNTEEAAMLAARIVTAGRPEGDEPDQAALVALAQAAGDEIFTEARSGSTRFISSQLTSALKRAVLHLDKSTPLVPPQNSAFHAQTIQKMHEAMGGDLTAWANVIVDFGDLSEEPDARLIEFIRARAGDALADAIMLGDHLR